MDAARIRQYVDGELSAADAAAVEHALASDASLRDAVAFERELRVSVARHLACDPPSGLRDQVARTLAAERTRCEVLPAGSGRVSSRGEGGGAAPHRRWSFLQNPSHANVFAVAACLVIVAGAIAFGVFGPPLLRPMPQQAASANLEQLGVTADAASVEHDRCSINSEALASKARYRDLASIQQHLSPRLGVSSVPVFDLRSAGFNLVGGGECGLCPTERNSVHLSYIRQDGKTRVSVFLQPNMGQFGGLQIGRIYWPEDFGTCQDTPACAWTDGVLIYVLLACDEQDHARALEAIRRTMGR